MISQNQWIPANVIQAGITGEFHEMWFCTKCQDEDRLWYHPQGSEEDRRQHDYINYYYEQKEKFAKRFKLYLFYLFYFV